jgi:hypothetical protein
MCEVTEGAKTTSSNGCFVDVDNGLSMLGLTMRCAVELSRCKGGVCDGELRSAGAARLPAPWLVAAWI